MSPLLGHKASILPNADVVTVAPDETTLPVCPLPAAIALKCGRGGCLWGLRRHLMMPSGPDCAGLPLPASHTLGWNSLVPLEPWHRHLHHCPQSPACSAQPRLEWNPVPGRGAGCRGLSRISGGPPPPVIMADTGIIWWEGTAWARVSAQFGLPEDPTLYLALALDQARLTRVRSSHALNPTRNDP